MGFVNERVPENERKDFKIPSYYKVVTPKYWTIDREKSIILFKYWTNIDEPSEKYFAFIWKDEIVNLREVLKNDNITSINGVSKQQFIDKYNEYAGQDIFQNISGKELDQTILNKVFDEIKTTRPAEYFDDVVVHYDSQGKIVSIDTTAISGGEFNKSTSSVFEIKAGEIRHFTTDTDMSTKYTDYDSYTTLEKIKAKQYDYERTQITQMLDDGVSSKDGISLLTSDEIKTKYGFVDDVTPENVVRELQIAEYYDRKNGTATAKEMEIYFDEDGKVFAAGNSKYKTTEVPDIDVESKFSTTAGD